MLTAASKRICIAALSWVRTRALFSFSRSSSKLLGRTELLATLDEFVGIDEGFEGLF